MSCRQGAPSGPLMIAAAANVQFAMEELEARFEEQTGIPVEVILSSSGKLAAQIRQGAPFDLFVSADTKYPEFLYQEGAAAGTPRIYAYGALVLWTLKDLDLSRDLAVLTDPSIRKIGMPNPKTAPYGEQAMLALQNSGLADSLQSRLVFGESIAQVNQYVLSGACEIGFTARSVVMAPELKGKGKWAELDKSTYRPIAQAVVITNYGQENNPETSRLFFDFLFSSEGRAIFQKFGYELP